MQAAKDKVQDAKNTFFSGGPGTTGREVFDDSTASGPGAAYSSTGGNTAGPGAGHIPGPNDYSETQTYKNTGGVLGARPRDDTRPHNLADPSAHGVGAAGVNSFGHNPHNDNVLGSAEKQTTSQGQYGSVSSVGGAHSVHRGLEAGGLGAAGVAVGAEAHHHHHHGHHGHHGDSQAPVGATGTTAATQQDLATGGTGRDAPAPSAVGGGVGTTNSSTDKTGTLGQDSHLYERTGNQGPLTSGAAGTDRFDTDKPSAATSNVTGGTTAGDYRVPEGEAGSSPKQSGGLMGILGTSDKDFTNRDRKGTGAYADTHGQYSMNTSGPAGNTALTGREGNPDTNPVAQAQSRGENAGAGVGTGAGTGATHVDSRQSLDEDGRPKKKGFMEKVKEALQ